MPLPREIYLGSPDFLEINIFWYTGQLILSKIIKIVATSCQILRLKCTKFDFGWAAPETQAVPETLLGELKVPPRYSSWI